MFYIITVFLSVSHAAKTGLYVIATLERCGIKLHSANVLTVADGAQRIIVLHALAYDPPLGEDGVWANGAYIK